VTNHRDFDDLLRAADGDAGCNATREVLEAYVESELAGGEPERVYPDAAVHLQACPGCRAEYEGLLEAARRFGDVKPE
jgi:predicted anti-sigma-YlaC factor YlaD